MQFSYVNPTMIHFGQGQIASIRRDIPKDHKVLVLYGGGSIKRNGVYDQVVEALSEHQWLNFPVLSLTQPRKHWIKRCT